MPPEQIDLCKVSTSDAACPANRSGNPAAAGSADAAASATGGDIFACTAHNQGPNSTCSGGGSRLRVFARSGRKRHASRTYGMQLQLVAIGENCGNLAQIVLMFVSVIGRVLACCLCPHSSPPLAVNSLSRAGTRELFDFDIDSVLRMTAVYILVLL